MKSGIIPNLKVTVLSTPATIFLLILNVTVVYGQTFPLKLSDNKRHFVDQQNKPFLINGDTPWQLIAKLSMKDIEDYLDNRKAKKINTIQIMLTRYQPVNGPNLAGIKPFVNANDFTLRNEAYFDFVEQVLIAARKRGIAVIIAPLWQESPNRADSITWRPVMRANGKQKNRAFGNYLGTRFHHSKHPNIIAWMMGGDNRLDFSYTYYKAVAEGVREKDRNVYLTYHLSGGFASSDEVDDDWLSLNSTYCYNPTINVRSKRHIYELSHHAYVRMPVIPFYLSEALYEGPKADNTFNNASAAYVRRQAYWSIVGGSTGHIYGPIFFAFNDSAWRAQLDMPGAFDLTHLSNFFNGFEWFKLVPVVNNTLVTDGYGTYDGFTASGDNYVASALTTDAKTGVIYLPPTDTSVRTITVDLGKLNGAVTAKWFNPNTGVFTTMSGSPFTNSGNKNFTTPGNNGDGVNDWVLLLDARKR